MLIDGWVLAQVPVSSVLPEERLLVRNVDEYPGIYHVIARYGEWFKWDMLFSSCHCLLASALVSTEDLCHPGLIWALSASFLLVHAK